MMALQWVAQSCLSLSPPPLLDPKACSNEESALRPWLNWCQLVIPDALCRLWLCCWHVGVTLLYWQTDDDGWRLYETIQEIPARGLWCWLHLWIQAHPLTCFDLFLWDLLLCFCFILFFFPCLGHCCSKIILLSTIVFFFPNFPIKGFLYFFLRQDWEQPQEVMQAHSRVGQLLSTFFQFILQNIPQQGLPSPSKIIQGFSDIPLG